MDNTKQLIRNLRRPKGHVSSLTTNIIHLRNPWVTALWSCTFPGFGHIFLGSYIKGFLLLIWEVLINVNAHINHAILYSFTGRFELAKNVLDKNWVFVYSGVFVYAIWDSYRSTIDLNKFSILADREHSPIIPFKISSLEINYFDKKNPWIALGWSALMPGMGHLYNHRTVSGFIFLIWYIFISFFSHSWEVIYYSFLGDYGNAMSVANSEWLLFVPSMYGFSSFDSYVTTVEHNNLFEYEQSKFLKDNYQDLSFDMPI